MRSSEEMFQLILTTAQRLPAVKAVALNGSRADSAIAQDVFQDFDIVYFVPDEALAELKADQSWLAPFGQLLIRQTPCDFDAATDFGGKYAFLMLFQDGNRLDLVLCPLSKIALWQQQDPVAKILYDPQGVLAATKLTDSRYYWVKEPTAKQFLECCNEFWWVATYVVKGLCRQEHFYASDHFYQYCYQELLHLLSWQAAEDRGYQLNVGKNHKYLLQYLPQETADRLVKLLDLSSAAKLKEHLLAAESLFHQTAQAFAQQKGFDYQLQEAENVQAYSKKQLAHLGKDR